LFLEDGRKEKGKEKEKKKKKKKKKGIQILLSKKKNNIPAWRHEQNTNPGEGMDAFCISPQKNNNLPHQQVIRIASIPRTKDQRYCLFLL
jgi:hypothetical protein